MAYTLLEVNRTNVNAFLEKYTINFDLTHPGTFYNFRKRSINGTLREFLQLARIGTDKVPTVMEHGEMDDETWNHFSDIALAHLSYLHKGDTDLERDDDRVLHMVDDFCALWKIKPRDKPVNKS